MPQQDKMLLNKLISSQRLQSRFNYLTKLDGTTKGGVVIGISDQFKIPVNYIGVGEGIYDLQSSIN